MSCLEVSVIIPTYNDALLLATCLDSLCRVNAPDGDWEIIISIDGSTDNTREMLRTGMTGRAPACSVIQEKYGKERKIESGCWKSLPLVIVDVKENAGRSAARNRALEKSKGEWLAFLDADLRVRSNWIDQHRRIQHNQKIISIGEMVYDVSGYDSKDAKLKKYQYYLQTRGPYKYRQRGNMPGRYFYTCNSLVHRSLLDKAGLFDERLRIWGGEDIDLGIRLEEAGGRLVYNSASRALHAQERSFRQHCGNLRKFGQAVIPVLLQKHPWLEKELKLSRLLKHTNSTFVDRVLRLLYKIDFEKFLLYWEEKTNGLFFNEKLYDLTVFLHYAGGFRNKTTSSSTNKV
jgi:glycosyltransferase involved in cell wall biosynthesis